MTIHILQDLGSGLLLMAFLLTVTWVCGKGKKLGMGDVKLAGTAALFAGLYSCLLYTSRERYEIDEEGGAAEQLRDIAEKRGCLRKGGEADTQKAAAILLEEFRSGKLGRITLEMP